MIRSCSRIKDFATHTQQFFGQLYKIKNLQGMIADNNFFDDNIVHITIKNKCVHLYM